MSTDSELEAARSCWKTLYGETLPEAARRRCTTQKEWPVRLDHCFARIILDHAVGGGTVPWTQCIKAPAYKNMSLAQLRGAIGLGNDVLAGRADLAALNRTSLAVRGKRGPERAVIRAGDEMVIEKRESGEIGMSGVKRKRAEMDGSTTEKVESTGRECKSEKKEEEEEKGEKDDDDDDDEALDIDVLLDRTGDLTPFRRTVLRLLSSVPRGRWTTYKAMSDRLASSPRAVGNAMRNNPHAPRIPCHRVLASDGSLGGFGGSWGPEGLHAREKVKLLRDEGVRFDGKGKVVGRPYTF